LFVVYSIQFPDTLYSSILGSPPASKKPRLDSQDCAKVEKLMEAIMMSKADPSEYANPSNMFEIPFPFIGEIPDRFILTKGMIGFMGREKFTQLWDAVLSLHVGVDWLSTESKPVFKKAMLYGTLGFGKSHMLAALVTLLIRQGERKIVYIPDCKAFLENSFQYMRSALLTTFFRDEERFIQVLNAQILVDLKYICLSVADGDLIFIIDQYNAIEVDDRLTANNEKKLTCQEFLNEISFKHCILRASSANNTTAVRDAHKQRSELDMKWFGGLSDNEWHQWALRFGTFLPSMDDDQLGRMRFGTGQVLLFLKAFTSPVHHDNDFEKAWESFILQQEVVDMRRHLIDFSLELSLPRETHIDMLKGCIMGYVKSDHNKYYDHRYLFVGKSLKAGCICGVASEIVAEILMDVNSGLFLECDWVQHCKVLHDNPPMKGFMAEKAVLAAMRKQGFHLPNVSIQIDSHVIFFTGKEAECLKSLENVLYVPDAFNYKAIDGLVRFITGKKLQIIAIQIFNGLRHSHSPSNFFPSCAVWESDCMGYDIEWHFCWISPTKRASILHAEKMHYLRGCQSRANPAYHEHFFSFGDIYSPLSFLDA
jgi:hypothetical protein